MTRSVLVTGGAGYIGSHMARVLRESGTRVTVLDNLSTGHADSVPPDELVVGDLRQGEQILSLLRRERFDAVMHFAAKCYVGESMSDPEAYFINNVTGTLNLLSAMHEIGLNRLVFSSSCSTYGEPQTTPIDETHAQSPVNPYGLSKLMCERMMAEYARAFSFDVIALRYFNAAGCDPRGDLGERHDPETHLVPLVLREALRVRGAPDDTRLEVFGTDFDTPDGTCVRDYVHVNDLCQAHLLALERQLTRSGGHFEAFNLGTEAGFSVRQVIDKCREVTKTAIPYVESARRPGDPARLVANSSLARKELGWAPKCDLTDIVSTAWVWFANSSPDSFGQ